MLNKRIALEVEKKANKKESGGLFIIPDAEDTAAIVKMVADGVEIVKVGDKVFYGRDYSTLKVKGSEYLVMEEGNIIAVESDNAERPNV